jgi:hypothetical protein
MIRVGSDIDCRHRDNSLSATHQCEAPPDKMVLLFVACSMRKINLLTVAVLLLSACSSLAQPRVFLTGSGHAVPLPTARGQQVVMASVSLGTTDTPLTISKIEAAGTMTTDPDLEGVSYELLFLVCDQPDCLGAVRSPVVLRQDDWQTPLHILASKSFGIVERHVAAEVLAEQGLHRDVGHLYVAMAIKLLHGSAFIPGTATAELLRVEVVP